MQRENQETGSYSREFSVAMKSMAGWREGLLVVPMIIFSKGDRALVNDAPVMLIGISVRIYAE